METCKAVTQKTNFFHTDIDQPHDIREERLYLIAYTLWLIAALMKETHWNDFDLVPMIRTYLNNTAYVLLLVKFFLKKRYTSRDAVGAALIIFFCFLAAHTHYHRYIIPMIIFMCSAGNVRFSSILKCTFAIQSLVMAATIAASQTGILEDTIWVQAERNRHSFGYEYCAYPAHLLLFITLIWFCIRKKVRILEVLAFSALNYTMYVYTETRADFFLSLLGIFGFSVWCRNYQSKWVQQLRSWITHYGFAVAALFSILLHCLYLPDNPLMVRLDHALSQRLRLGSDAITTYGFSLFGTAIRWIGQGSVKKNPRLNYNYVDCAFLKETLSYGIIFLIILGILFYLAGKMIVQTENHYLGWAVIITLIYASVNAQFCMLVFNVFILVPGMLFSNKDIILLPEISFSKPEKLTPTKVQGAFSAFLAYIDRQMQIFSDTVGKTFCCISSDWTKSKLRSAVFFLLFIYLIFVQHQGKEYMTKWSSIHMWVTNIALFLLTILCWEGKRTRRLKRSLLLTATETFLFLICISDFAVKKDFAYSGFFLLISGGLFCQSWCAMEKPELLLKDFKYAYKANFFLILIYCLAFRPASFDLCYTGICTDAETFGILMLIAMAVFLNDTLEKQIDYINGICAVIACYLVLLTRKLTIIPLAGILILFYMVFWILAWLKSVPSLKKIRTKKLLYSIIGGLIAVLLIHHLLHFFSPLLEMQTVSASNADMAEITLFSLIFGETGLPDFQDLWPQNNLILHLFHYGIPVGIGCAAMVVIYWGKGLYQSLKQIDFFLFSALILCTGTGLPGILEMPFTQIPWFLFYLTLGWMIVSAK